MYLEKAGNNRRVKGCERTRKDLNEYFAQFSEGMNLRTVLENVVVIKRCEKVLTGTEQFVELCENYRIQIRAWRRLAIN